MPKVSKPIDQEKIDTLDWRQSLSILLHELTYLVRDAREYIREDRKRAKSA